MTDIAIYGAGGFGREVNLIIQQLIKKGYLLRKRTEEDKRVVLVELTDKGMEAKKMHDAFHQDMIASVIETLNEEEESILIQALEKLIGFFDGKYRNRKE